MLLGMNQTNKQIYLQSRFLDALIGLINLSPCVIMPLSLRNGSASTLAPYHETHTVRYPSSTRVCAFRVNSEEEQVITETMLPYSVTKFCGDICVETEAVPFESLTLTSPQFPSQSCIRQSVHFPRLICEAIPFTSYLGLQTLKCHYKTGLCTFQVSDEQRKTRLYMDFSFPGFPGLPWPD